MIGQICHVLSEPTGFSLQPGGENNFTLPHENAKRAGGRTLSIFFVAVRNSNNIYEAFKNRFLAK